MKHSGKTGLFPGVHSDVGGGYSERHHSDMALKWMVEQSKVNGLLIKADQKYEYCINLRKDIHSSAFDIFGLEIGVEHRDAPVTMTHKPTAHSSIREKMKLVQHYKPLALWKHITDSVNLTPYDVEE